MQNQAMTVIGGYIRSIPVHVTEIDHQLQPLDKRRNWRCLTVKSYK